MITARPDQFDYELYHLLPLEDRWIVNKLTLAEKLGYDCGPSGTFPTTHSTYCVRPVYSMAGMGSGGFRKVRYQGEGVDVIRPSSFWCEWFDGRHSWTDFTDDVAVRQFGGDMVGDLLPCEEENISMAVPEWALGISKHMLVEHIGGRIIEISPKHMNSRDTIMQRVPHLHGWSWIESDRPKK